MRKHRSPRNRVSDAIEPHNTDDTDNTDTPDIPDTPDAFNPGDALESLYLQVVDLEALANAANEAVVQLPFPKSREERRPFDRVYSLITKFADETSAVVKHGSKLMDGLEAHLQRKRAEADA